MTGSVARVAIVCGALFIAASVSAEEGEVSGRFEVTPFAGFGFGGDFEDSDTGAELEFDDAGTFGLIFNAQAQYNTQYEIIYSRQSTEIDTSAIFVNEPVLDIDVQYLQLGGTYVFEGELAQPYIALTAGIAHFDPDPAGFDSETFGSFSFGVGARILPFERVGIRVEGRYFGTFTDSDSDVFCRTGPDNNVCAIRVEGDLFSQWQAFAGVTFRF